MLKVSQVSKNTQEKCHKITGWAVALLPREELNDLAETGVKSRGLSIAGLD